MILYRVLGDAVATDDARNLAEQLVEWHDEMVNHLRVVNARRSECDDGCAHDQAYLLWTQAVDLFGDDAARLTFLRKYGERAIPPPAGRAAHAEA